MDHILGSLTIEKYNIVHNGILTTECENLSLRSLACIPGVTIMLDPWVLDPEVPSPYNDLSCLVRCKH